MVTRVSLKNSSYLLELLRRNIPSSQPIFNCLDMAIKYDAPFFTFFTKEKSSSLVAATDRHPLTDVQILKLIWDPTEHSNEEVHDFLKQIPTLQWGRPIYLNFINSTLSENLKEILSSPELTGGKMKTIRYDSNFFAFDKISFPYKDLLEDWPDDFTPRTRPITFEYSQKLSKARNEIISSKLPDCFEICRLREKDIEFTLSNWYQRPVDVKRFIERFRKIPSYAVYKKGDLETNPLCVFIVSSYGLATSGYTDPNYRKMGFADVIILYTMFEQILNGVTPLGSGRIDREDVVQIMSKYGLLKAKETFHEIYYNENDINAKLPYF